MPIHLNPGNLNQYGFKIGSDGLPEATDFSFNDLGKYTFMDNNRQIFALRVVNGQLAWFQLGAPRKQEEPKRSRSRSREREDDREEKDREEKDKSRSRERSREEKRSRRKRSRSRRKKFKAPKMITPSKSRAKPEEILSQGDEFKVTDLFTESTAPEAEDKKQESEDLEEEELETESVELDDERPSSKKEERSSSVENTLKSWLFASLFSAQRMPRTKKEDEYTGESLEGDRAEDVRRRKDEDERIKKEREELEKKFTEDLQSRERQAEADRKAFMDETNRQVTEIKLKAEQEAERIKKEKGEEEAIKLLAEAKRKADELERSAQQKADDIKRKAEEEKARLLAENDIKIKQAQSDRLKAEHSKLERQLKEAKRNFEDAITNSVKESYKLQVELLESVKATKQAEIQEVDKSLVDAIAEEEERQRQERERQERERQERERQERERQERERQERERQERERQERERQERERQERERQEREANNAEADTNIKLIDQLAITLPDTRLDISQKNIQTLFAPIIQDCLMIKSFIHLIQRLPQNKVYNKSNAYGPPFMKINNFKGKTINVALDNYSALNIHFPKTYDSSKPFEIKFFPPEEFYDKNNYHDNDETLKNEVQNYYEGYTAEIPNDFNDKVKNFIDEYVDDFFTTTLLPCLNNKKWILEKYFGKEIELELTYDDTNANAIIQISAPVQFDLIKSTIHSQDSTDEIFNLINNNLPKPIIFQKIDDKKWLKFSGIKLISIYHFLNYVKKKNTDSEQILSDIFKYLKEYKKWDVRDTAKKDILDLMKVKDYDQNKEKIQKLIENWPVPDKSEAESTEYPRWANQEKNKKFAEQIIKELIENIKSFDSDDLFNESITQSSSSNFKPSIRRKRTTKNFIDIVYYIKQITERQRIPKLVKDILPEYLTNTNLKNVLEFSNMKNRLENVLLEYLNQRMYQNIEKKINYQDNSGNKVNRNQIFLNLKKIDLGNLKTLVAKDDLGGKDGPIFKAVQDVIGTKIITTKIGEPDKVIDVYNLFKDDEEMMEKYHELVKGLAQEAIQQLENKAKTDGASRDTNIGDTSDSPSEDQVLYESIIQLLQNKEENNPFDRVFKSNNSKSKLSLDQIDDIIKNYKDNALSESTFTHNLIVIAMKFFGKINVHTKEKSAPHKIAERVGKLDEYNNLLKDRLELLKRELESGRPKVEIDPEMRDKLKRRTKENPVKLDKIISEDDQRVISIKKGEENANPIVKLFMLLEPTVYDALAQVSRNKRVTEGSLKKGEHKFEKFQVDLMITGGSAVNLHFPKITLSNDIDVKVMPPANIFNYQTFKGRDEDKQKFQLRINNTVNNIRVRQITPFLLGRVGNEIERLKTKKAIPSYFNNLTVFTAVPDSKAQGRLTEIESSEETKSLPDGITKKITKYFFMGIDKKKTPIRYDKVIKIVAKYKDDLNKDKFFELMDISNDINLFKIEKPRNEVNPRDIIFYRNSFEGDIYDFYRTLHSDQRGVKFVSHKLDRDNINFESLRYVIFNNFILQLISLEEKKRAQISDLPSQKKSILVKTAEDRFNKYKNRFEKIISKIPDRIEVISNLKTYVNQLVSDYVKPEYLDKVFECRLDKSGKFIWYLSDPSIRGCADFDQKTKNPINRRIKEIIDEVKKLPVKITGSVLIPKYDLSGMDEAEAEISDEKIRILEEQLKKYRDILKVKRLQGPEEEELNEFERQWCMKKLIPRQKLKVDQLCSKLGMIIKMNKFNSMLEAVENWILNNNPDREHDDLNNNPDREHDELFAVIRFFDDEKMEIFKRFFSDDFRNKNKLVFMYDNLKGKDNLTREISTKYIQEILQPSIISEIDGLSKESLTSLDRINIKKYQELHRARKIVLPDATLRKLEDLLKSDLGGLLRQIAQLYEKRANLGKTDFKQIEEIINTVIREKLRPKLSEKENQTNYKKYQELRRLYMVRKKQIRTEKEKQEHMEKLELLLAKTEDFSEQEVHDLFELKRFINLISSEDEFTNQLKQKLNQAILKYTEQISSKINQLYERIKDISSLPPRQLSLIKNLSKEIDNRKLEISDDVRGKLDLLNIELPGNREPEQPRGEEESANYGTMTFDALDLLYNKIIDRECKDAEDSEKLAEILVAMNNRNDPNLNFDDICSLFIDLPDQCNKDAIKTKFESQTRRNCPANPITNIGNTSDPPNKEDLDLYKRIKEVLENNNENNPFDNVFKNDFNLMQNEVEFLLREYPNVDKYDFKHNITQFVMKDYGKIGQVDNANNHPRKIAERAGKLDEYDNLVKARLEKLYPQTGSGQIPYPTRYLRHIRRQISQSGGGEFPKYDKYCQAVMIISDQYDLDYDLLMPFTSAHNLDFNCQNLLRIID